VPLCLGPLGRSSEDLALWMKIVTNNENFKDNFDPYTKIVPFDDKEYLKAKEGGKKYKIGYFKSFEMIEATPGCQRVVDDVCQLLKEEGHTVVKIEIPNVNECLSEYFVEASSAGI
jgi:Asp-tRNA(Asn)/Glu-tRNA(Gln) amidotransferase A subunit family amidase